MRSFISFSMRQRKILAETSIRNVEEDMKKQSTVEGYVLKNTKYITKSQHLSMHPKPTVFGNNSSA